MHVLYQRASTRDRHHSHGGGHPVSCGHHHFGEAPPHLLRNSHAPFPILPYRYHDDSDRV